MTGKPTLQFPALSGYRTTSAITVNEGVSVVMDDRIVLDSASAICAITIGRAGHRNFKITAKINVERADVIASVSESDIGVEFINAYYCNIEIRNIYKFSVDSRFTGDGFGFVYNIVTLGRIGTAHIGVDCYSKNGGWCNENIFIAGEFVGSIAKDNACYGVRVSNTSASVAASDNTLRS